MCEIANIAVLISGNGSNLQRIIDEISTKTLPNCYISVVLSNKSNAYGLQRATDANIPISLFPFRKNEMERIDYDRKLAKHLLTYKPDIVVLAGWMRILSSAFFKHFKHIINLHPALPGQFPGINAIERAYDASRAFYNKTTTNRDAAGTKKVFYTGAMCHRVVEKVDAGKALAVVTIPIMPEDTLQHLKDVFAEKEKLALVTGLRNTLSNTIIAQTAYI